MSFNGYRKQALSFVLTVLIAMQLVPEALAADGVASQIAAIPPGSKIALRLKNKLRMTGTAGAVSSGGFTLIDAHAETHQVAFDDVAMVKRIDTKSHALRNVLIVAGIGVAATAIGIAVYAKKCPLGCNSRSLVP